MTRRPAGRLPRRLFRGLPEPSSAQISQIHHPCGLTCGALLQDGPAAAGRAGAAPTGTLNPLAVMPVAPRFQYLPIAMPGATAAAVVTAGGPGGAGPGGAAAAGGLLASKGRLSTASLGKLAASGAVLSTAGQRAQALTCLLRFAFSPLIVWSCRFRRSERLVERPGRSLQLRRPGHRRRVGRGGARRGGRGGRRRLGRCVPSGSLFRRTAQKRRA